MTSAHRTRGVCRGAKFAATAGLAGKQYPTPAGTVAEVEREAAGSHRGQGARIRDPLSPSLSAPSIVGRA